MSTTPHSGSDTEVKQALEKTRSEAAHLASSAADAAKQRGKDTVDRAKDRAADEAEGLASALEATADDLDSNGGNDALSGYGRSMASMIRRFAGGLREQEIEEFAGQLASFARRNPASFLAGSVALGFGVSRFLKASSARDYGYEGDDEYLFESDEEFDEGYMDTQSASGSEWQPEESTSASASAWTDTQSERWPEDRSDEQSTSSQHWPEDQGRERPGAGSATEHWSPAVSAEPSRSTVGEGTIAGGAAGVGESSSERVETKSQETRRNEP